MPNSGPQPSHVHIEQFGSEIRIVILPRRWGEHLGDLLFVLLWTCGWGLGGVAIARECFAGSVAAQGQPPGAVLQAVAAIIICSVPVLIGLLLLVRVHLGTEVILASPQRLGRSCTPLGRYWEYPAAEVRNLRVDRRDGWPGPRPSVFDSDSKLAFEYGTRTVRFGEMIDWAEAALLVEIIRSHLGAAASGG
jgi:hypothetical protein